MKCGSFCSVFINPCIFHTGVLVLTPNELVLQDMLTKTTLLPSYDGGDQGFLNSYFGRMLTAPLFRGERNDNESTNMRLPFGYSMDHFFYYQRLQWEVPCSEQKAFFIKWIFF